LAGPNPLNDFRALVELGVHPSNIFAFEAEKGLYRDALLSIRESEFPMLKLHLGSLEHYLQSAPRRFDIIYVDACGPLPSSSQRTLQLVTTIFRNQRLASPGVLVTNFSEPDRAGRYADAHAELIAALLYPKEFLESHKASWNLTDGVAVEGMLCRDDQEEGQSLYHRIKTDLSGYYGQFITRLLFDLSSFVVPLVRLANSDLWRTFFQGSPRDVAALAMSMRTFSDDGDGGDFVVHPEMHSSAWTLTALRPDADAPLSADYPPLVPLKESLRKVFHSELVGHPKLKFDATTAVYAYSTIRERNQAELEKILTTEFSAALADFAWWDKLFTFCDVPTNELVLFPALAQYAFPMHYNVSEVWRASYVAEGKQTKMFIDVIPFDECRYVYDWLPAVPMMRESMEQYGAFELVYRFALDGVAKHRLRYSSEYLYGVNAVDIMGAEEFVERVLKRRRVIGSPRKST
jgi:hypothetical protein